MEFVFEERAAKFLVHESLALARVLPIGKAHFSDNVIDVGDNPLDNDVRVPVLGLAR